MCKYDNKYAYCLEASKKSPSVGKYPAQVIENNEAVRKILYYGFGGPGYDQAIKEMYTVELNSCVPDDLEKSMVTLMMVLICLPIFGFLMLMAEI